MSDKTMARRPLPAPGFDDAAERTSASERLADGARRDDRRRVRDVKRGQRSLLDPETNDDLDVERQRKESAEDDARRQAKLF